MSKFLILIQLFIVSVIAIYNENELSNKSESRVINHSFNETKVNTTRINCDNYVSLQGKLHILVGGNDIAVYCIVRFGRKCNFTERNIKFELIVNDSSYDMGSVDCKSYNYNGYNHRESCYMKFSFGIYDLDERRINGNDLNIKCKASGNIGVGMIEGTSQAGKLKVIRGGAHGEKCSETKPCMSGRNMTCISNQCSCMNQNGVDFVTPDKYGINTCLSRVAYNDKCIDSNQCNLEKYGSINTNVYNSQCRQTGIGKLCQCIIGYYWDGIRCMNGQNERECPSCTCNYYPRNTDWDFYLNLILFFCGMLAGIFTYKIALYCIKKAPILCRAIYQWGQPIGGKIRNYQFRFFKPEFSTKDNHYSNMNFDKQELGKELDSVKTKSIDNNY